MRLFYDVIIEIKYFILIFKGVLENNIRLGLKLGNYKFAILIAAMAQFGILHNNQHIRKELILGQFRI